MKSNDIRSSSPKQLADDIDTNLMKIKFQCSKQTQVAFSSILKRKDDHLLNGKVMKTNELLKETLLLNGFDMIDNDNIISSNVSKDGLHLNEGGVKKFAANLSKYLRYC